MTSYLASILKAVAFFMWTPAAVFAAALYTTGGTQSELNVPPVLLIASAFLATLAAATTLCKRVLDEYKANDAAGQPDKPLVRPWLFAVSHMLGSWLAGAGFFLVGMSQGVNVWMLLAMVLVASFGGAVVVERMAENWLPKILPGRMK